jgi:hypothetical protein
MVDVRRLKLQQLLQLFTCEKDCQQAITWIEELHDTLLSDYKYTSGIDLSQLKGDQNKLEQTARVSGIVAF